MHSGEGGWGWVWVEGKEGMEMREECGRSAGRV